MTAETAATADSNYHRYWQAEFNRPEHYPPAQSLDPARYRPIGQWMGRLILPALAERQRVMGAWLELYHAPDQHRPLVGTRVRLRWEQTPDLNARLWGATRNVHFDENALRAAAEGTILAERVNGLVYVNPFESLAGAHPYDDVVVRLQGNVRVDPQPADGGEPIVCVSHVPAEITGRFYALVRFVGPAGDGDGYRVRHYDRAAGDFSGPEELVRLPEVVPDSNDTRNSAAAGIERSPCNDLGWYIYGAQDTAGRFVVRGVAPRQILRLQQQIFCDGMDECMDYLKPKAWKKAAQKGQATTALLVGVGVTPHRAREDWKVGDQALLIHLYGGIGGAKVEPAAKAPLYWGHFAFGEATVIDEPLAGEACFDIVYHQIYAHNPDGLSAGAHHYSRYAADRQYGWAGIRPIQDLIIKLDGITGSFSIFGAQISALDSIISSLEVMEARYRIADGRGGTRVGAANNCAQDSAQALYGAIRGISKLLASRADIKAEMTDTPEEAQRFAQLTAVGEELRKVLVPWGSARDDWEYGIANLGDSGEGLFGTIGKAVSSWRTMLPPVAARAITEVFLERGGSVWVLRTYQVGGDDPEVEPVVPNV